MRDGTICLEDYNGQHVEVVRQKRTGLFMIRIDHLIMDPANDGCPDRAPEALKNLILSKEPEKDNSDVESGSTTSVEHESAFMAATAPAGLLEADCFAVSCGLANFEESGYSTGASHTVQNMLGRNLAERKKNIYPGGLKRTRSYARRSSNLSRLAFPS